LKSTFHVPLKLVCAIDAAGVASIVKHPVISRPLIIPPALQQSSQSDLNSLVHFAH
jgi:hypothetical protein